MNPEKIGRLATNEEIERLLEDTEVDKLSDDEIKDVLGATSNKVPNPPKNRYGLVPRHN